MTTKQLTARQARWAEKLASYNFKVMYRPRKQNAKADILTCQEDDKLAQDIVKSDYRTRAFLSPD